MMAEFSLVCCRVCRGKIQTDTEICPLCSSRQNLEKKRCSTTVIILLAVLGFVCITLLGFMSAHAIQQAIYSRTDTSNEKAMQNVSLAKIAVDNYMADHDQIPENLSQFAFQADENI